MNIHAIEKPTYRGGTEVEIVLTEVADQRGKLAEHILYQLSIASCRFDGEDSAGRQKMTLLTPTECAARACDIAAATWTEFKTRGWLLAVPLPKPEKTKEEL